MENLTTTDENTMKYYYDEDNYVVLTYVETYRPTQEEINTANIDYLLMLQGEK